MKYFLSYLTQCLCYLFFYSLVSNCYAQQPQPVLCFDFYGNLNANGNAVAMTPIDGVGGFSEGESICKLDSLYSWDISTGLILQDPANYFPQDHYTIELLFKFTTQPYPSLWQKIIDFKNRTSDRGLYLYNSNLQMYEQYTGTSSTAQPDTWFRLFLTRDASTDSIKGYINNNLEIALEDVLGNGIFTDALILFKDDSLTIREESAGIIDYVRIYDYPLSEEEIGTLVRTPVVNITGDISACPGDRLVLQANGADSYLWSTGETTSTIIVYPTMQDTISLTGALNIGCMQSCHSDPDTILLSTYHVSNVNLGADVVFCPREKVVLDAGNNYIAYDWSDGSIAQTLAVSQAMEYWVLAVDINNCLSSDTINLFVGLECEPPKIEGAKNVFVPNVFTPNADGLNDQFKIKWEGVKEIDLQVFNRWGNLLYETDSKSDNWDGTYEGVHVNSGTYFYTLSVVFDDDTEINRKGHINVSY